MKAAAAAAQDALMIPVDVDMQPKREVIAQYTVD